MREIEEMLEIPKSTIDRYIQRLGLVNRLDIWITRELEEIHLTKRNNACLFSGIGKVWIFLAASKEPND